MAYYEIALEFDTDASEFARGVEIGRLWEMFKQPEAFEQTIRADNVEMVLRIAKEHGRQVRAEFSSDEYWMFLIVEANGA